MAPNRPSGDRLVQLVAVPSTEEADVIVAMLAGHGIRARTSAETALLDPHHRRPDEGARVMVRAADLGRARELLEEDRPELM